MASAKIKWQKCDRNEWDARIDSRICATIYRDHPPKMVTTKRSATDKSGGYVYTLSVSGMGIVSPCPIVAGMDLRQAKRAAESFITSTMAR